MSATAEYTVGLSQEQIAVLDAIRQVCEMTGFGHVTVEIKDGHVRLVEISATVLIRRADEARTETV